MLRTRPGIDRATGRHIQVPLDQPLDDSGPRAGDASCRSFLDQGPSCGGLRPHEGQAPVTLSITNTARREYCAKSAARMAQALQQAGRYNPRLTGQELTAILGAGPLVDVTQLHGVNDLDSLAQLVQQYRRDHHRQARHSAPDRMSAADASYAIGRSEKQWTRYVGNLIPDLADDRGTWPRAWVQALVREMAALNLTNVKRLSTWQADQLRRAAHAIDPDDDTIEVGL